MDENSFLSFMFYSQIFIPLEDEDLLTGGTSTFLHKNDVISKERSDWEILKIIKKISPCGRNDRSRTYASRY